MLAIVLEHASGDFVVVEVRGHVLTQNRVVEDVIASCGGA
jgi:hypothetical protein